MTEQVKNSEKRIRHRRTREGIVLSDKMDKTIVVQTTRLVQHPLYKKVIKVRSKYKAHDEKNEAKEGDRVRITQTRPLSKTKRWRLARIIETKRIK